MFECFKFVTYTFFNTNSFLWKKFLFYLNWFKTPFFISALLSKKANIGKEFFDEDIFEINESKELVLVYVLKKLLYNLNLKYE